MLGKTKKKCYNRLGCDLMEYTVTIDAFEGPLDLLLHLIKESNINIWDIQIDEITKQYLDYINAMEKMNLNIASEYLTMAAELIEIKSSSLLPKKEMPEDEYEEDKRENLINRLIEYEQFKNMTSVFKEMENARSEIYTRSPSDLEEYQDEIKYDEKVLDLDVLINAFNNFLNRQELDKPLNTKIASREYSVDKRNVEIKGILKKKKRVEFFELFDKLEKDYIVVTFLSILDLAKKQELEIVQDKNFNNIILIDKERG